MHTYCNHFLRAGLLALLLPLSKLNALAQPSSWLTDPDQSVLFEKQPLDLAFNDGIADHASAAADRQTIRVDQTKTFQTIDGFGCCLTGGSATHLIRMAPADRAALLQELFATDGTH